MSEEMLATGDEKSLFNGDLNGFVNNATWAERGVTSCGMGGFLEGFEMKYMERSWSPGYLLKYLDYLAAPPPVSQLVEWDRKVKKMMTFMMPPKGDSTHGGNIPGDISEDETSMAEPPTTATALMSEGMNDEGIALMASAVEAEETAMAALQQARRSLKEARAKQHQVKMSRQYYKVTTSDKSRPAGDSAGKGGIKCFRCGGPHKIANCPDRTAPPRHEQGHVAQEEAPFVCYAEADTEAVTLFAEDAYMTETRVPKSRKSTEQAIAEGYGIVDGGATKTLGSVYAMEALVNANLKKHQDGRVLEVDVNNQPVFGFGNSSRDKCLSTTKMRISANQKDGVLTIHTLDRGEGPVLLSIDTLRKLKAIIDFEEDLVVFRALDPNQVIQLERSQAGHRLLPLTDDLYKSALPSAQELEEEKGIIRAHGKVRTSHQSWMVRLGKANKKKADLIAFCQNDLLLHLEGTETIPQLEKKAVEKIYTISESDGRDPMGFGMHSQLSYQQVAEEHPSYGEWAVRTMQEGSCHPRLERFALWLQSQKEKTEELLTESQYVKKKGMTSTSDKVTGKTPAGYVKPKAKAAPATSSADLSAQTVMLKMMDTLTTLKEDVEALKEERPHKKKEKSEDDFTMVSEMASEATEA
ncbi:CCHC-type domain-containing protein [Durusdinium trenchii]|uniref:CCHC-type domain-containing protein n=1 Tax=Durusdinium trenchii TaxID=1381693 RepID=A0ABP0HDC9_9DINO